MGQGSSEPSSTHGLWSIFVDLQDIQQEIFRLTGAPAYRQRLLFESDVLDPRRRLQDLGFTKERLRVRKKETKRWVSFKAPNEHGVRMV